MKKSGSALLFKLLGIALLAVCVPGAGQAQPYPNKPIKVIAAISAGGPGDALFRIVGEKLTERWGQPVLVDNRPGANTIVGMEAGVKAPADGYTWMLTSDASVAGNPSLYSKLPYDPVKDFEPISLLGGATQFLVIPASVPANSLRELIALAKAKPGSLSYASSGVGSSQHINFETFKRVAGVDILHVPYKGVSAALTDLVGGQVSMYIFPDSFLLPYIKAGKLRALAVVGPDPMSHSSLLPTVPTFAEAGMPDYEPLSSWAVLLAPAGTPKDIITKIHGEIFRIMKNPEVQTRIAGLGLEPLVSNSPQEFKEFIRTETLKWSKAIKESGAKLD